MTRTIASRRQRGASGRFVGRHAEQQLFRATLRQLAALRGRPDAQLTDDDLSYAQIFLVAAEGGMGKSTLLRRFAEIVREDADGAGALALYLDWERHPLIGSPDRIMDVLHQELCAAGFEGELQPYRDAQVRRAEAQRKAADAEEKYRSLMHGAGGPEELRAFIQKKLAPDEWKLYDDAEALTEPFMEALNRIATPARWRCCWTPTSWPTTAIAGCVSVPSVRATRAWSGRSPAARGSRSSAAMRTSSAGAQSGASCSTPSIAAISWPTSSSVASPRRTTS